jgi:ParB-like chromosome segregation protein Spo0J
MTMNVPATATYVPDAEADDGLILDEQPYQVMDSLPPQKYTQLKESIKKYGILNPIHVTTDKHVIDGHHRLLACRELERDLPGGLDDMRLPEFVTHVEVGADEDERSMAWKLNMQQRHLDTEEKQQLIEKRLQQLDESDEYRTNSKIAQTLGVSESWVRQTRNRLIESGNIRTTAEITTDTDGRRSKEDAAIKRDRVKAALKTDPTRSNREIARRIDVSHPFVGDVRDELYGETLPTEEEAWSVNELDSVISVVHDTESVRVQCLETIDGEYVVRLCDKGFYTQQGITGRGLNEAWTLVRTVEHTLHEAIQAINAFIFSRDTYRQCKAEQLREEGLDVVLDGPAQSQKGAVGE